MNQSSLHWHFDTRNHNYISLEGYMWNIKVTGVWFWVYLVALYRCWHILVVPEEFWNCVARERLVGTFIVVSNILTQIYYHWLHHVQWQIRSIEHFVFLFTIKYQVFWHTKAVFEKDRTWNNINLTCDNNGSRTMNSQRACVAPLIQLYSIKCLHI